MVGEGWRTLIVGAGNIGAFYDAPDSSAVLTHAHAFRSVPGFSLVGFVDVDAKKTDDATRIWGGQSFSSLGAAFAHGRVDVASVTVPDHLHFKVLKELAHYAPRLIFCEKPLATSFNEAGELEELFRGTTTLVAVNYLRRYIPEFISIKEAIATGRNGPFLCGTGYYTGGFMHNGSHMVDLLRDWVGEIARVEKKEDSFDIQGKAVEAVRTVRFDSGAAFEMRSVPGEPYWIFEADLFFEKKRFRMIESGFAIEEYDVRENELFKGSMDIMRTNVLATSLGSGMEHAVLNLRSVLAGTGTLRCPLSEARRTLNLCLEAL